VAEDSTARPSTGKVQRKVVEKAAESEAPATMSLKDPAYLTAWRKQETRTLLKRWGDDLAGLNLSPDKAARLIELMLNETESTLDAEEAALAAGLTGDEVKRAVRQARSVVHNDVKALLGEEASAEMVRLSMAKPYAAKIEDTFGVDLKAAGMPLTREQVTALALSYHEVTQSYGPAGRIGEPPNPQTGLTPVQEAWLNRYSTHLTAAQMQVVKNYFVDDAKWSVISSGPRTVRGKSR
jgi:hypothetical protein